MLNGGWSVHNRDKVSLSSNLTLTSRLNLTLAFRAYTHQTEATALMWAATEGHLPMVKFLIEEDADLNAKNNVSTTLHY